MTRSQALAFVKHHGVVLVSAQGPVPNLVHAIAGEAVRGSWWGHPKGHEIFRVLSAVEESPDLLCCRLVGGKLTFVHRRIWPALVRLAARFPRADLASVAQVHMPTGEHRVKKVPFPRWVPGEVKAAARALSKGAAATLLGDWVSTPRGSAPAKRGARRPRP